MIFEIADVNIQMLRSKLVIEKGLVLTVGSKVTQGSNYVWTIPSLESTIAAYKLLMGVKKKRIVVDDESEKSVAHNSSDDESDAVSEASETPTEIVECEDD
jgi:hypothetical protein